eukprot:TRINITY_DN4884_c0_g1_i1.p1 TRINITY_DN4884_c0_g1~~TRINITY_DN4884_c0_g1_i1.p1  ORF type:complete len:359 (-),score=38.59 TRINITY_DN4884_c0_g1_i1:324-1400(-)
MSMSARSHPTRLVSGNSVSFVEVHANNGSSTPKSHVQATVAGSSLVGPSTNFSKPDQRVAQPVCQQVIFSPVERGAATETIPEDETILDSVTASVEGALTSLLHNFLPKTFSTDRGQSDLWTGGCCSNPLDEPEFTLNYSAISSRTWESSEKILSCGQDTMYHVRTGAEVLEEDPGSDLEVVADECGTAEDPLTRDIKGDLKAFRHACSDLFTQRGWSIRHVQGNRYKINKREVSLVKMPFGGTVQHAEMFTFYMDWVSMAAAELAAPITVVDGPMKQPLLDYLLQSGMREVWDRRGTENTDGVAGMGRLHTFNMPTSDDRIAEMGKALAQANARRRADSLGGSSTSSNSYYVSVRHH